VLSGKNKYHAHAFQLCSKMPSHPTIIFERAPREPDPSLRG
jgi:hypothetical protein